MNDRNENKNEKIILKPHEEKAIKVYIVGVWKELEDAESIISETMILYYKKRMYHNFNTFEDTLKWLKVASKFGKLKSDSLLNETNHNRIQAKNRYLREVIWEEENNQNNLWDTEEND